MSQIENTSNVLQSMVGSLSCISYHREFYGLESWYGVNVRIKKDVILGYGDHIFLSENLVNIA
jgi:hypothetical protein